MSEYTLPYRPILQQDESPASLLLRAAEGNGFANILQLLSACGANFNGIASVRASLTDPNRYGTLLRALGLNTDYARAALRRSKPTLASPRILWETAIPERLFREDATAFCPLCLAEQPYWRLIWTLRPYSVCHVHGTSLLQYCPDCNRPPDLKREHLTTCGCGANWRKAVAPANDLASSRWLYEHIRNQSQQLLDECFALWRALEIFDGLGDATDAVLWRLRLMISWCEDRDVCREEIKRFVLERAPQQHPRVQLLPLLKQRGALASFARQVLSSLKRIPPVNHRSTSQTLMSIQDATYALGVNIQQIREFLDKGILTKQPGNDSNDFSVTVQEVEHLLEALQFTTPPLEQYIWRAANQSLADLIIDIRNGRTISAGYDLEKGLNYIRILDRPVISPSSGGELDLWEASRALDVYPEVVRSLVKKGWLAGVSKVVAGHRKLVIDGDEIERFNNQYTTAGTLARSIRHSSTNFAEKLECLGASPIAGPRLDGTLVYLFRRTDLVDVDLLAIKALSGYESRTGRHPHGRAIQTEPGIPLIVAAKRLRISVQQAAKLMQHGMLDEEQTNTRNVCVTESSLCKLLEIVFSPEIFSIKEAAKISGYDDHAFQVYFIETGLVEIIDLHVWKFIPEKALKIVESIKKSFLTASEAGQLFGMHRSFLPNLERKGEIYPLIFGSKRKIKFYSKESIRKIAESRGVRIDFGISSDVKS
ncbi:hypothetical protein CXB49_10925 [Chromobacterium sp. ATCC 53434]|uniref:TniQ family protein n=1 Tax=Chromobacterium sp. (strain ATCC 53434 / SC 14030) TaxID=2059672 RepID=UPI000C759F16|nr:TniQ family protein [Chromobacterium sp. ATCC 53434]AUH51289.1 hypothetical protein CXB49_10925 [Chromobacterium sp. ATCC 53434]